MIKDNGAIKALPYAAVPRATNAEVDQNETSDRHRLAARAEEMKASVALNFIMGLKNLTEYADYRSTEPILHDAFVAAIMRRRRYEKLCQFMHCSIAADEEQASKVRPLIRLCQQNLRACSLTMRTSSLMAGLLGSSKYRRSRSRGMKLGHCRTAV